MQETIPHFFTEKTVYKKVNTLNIPHTMAAQINNFHFVVLKKIIFFNILSRAAAHVIAAIFRGACH